MLQNEILIAPNLEFVVRRDSSMGVASGLHRGVEGDCVGVLLCAPAIEHRRQVGTATEPCFGGDDKARVHMDGRHMWIMHVGNQRNAGRKETRIVGSAGYLLAEFRSEFAEPR